MKKSILLMALCAASALAGSTGGPWELKWFTIDGGGEIAAQGNQWSLSGTFGQWDSTEMAHAAGGPWELTGGFWSSIASNTDVMFKDGFEM